jgi:triosephosphate isomerase
MQQVLLSDTAKEDNIMEKLTACNRKVKLALDKGLIPVYCNGETWNKENLGNTLK